MSLGINMAEEENKKAEEEKTEITHLVEQKEGKRFNLRTILIFILLLVSGLFLGILFGYLFK